MGGWGSAANHKQYRQHVVCVLVCDGVRLD